jgi:hypothetical protein
MVLGDVVIVVVGGCESGVDTKSKPLDDTESSPKHE